VCPRAVRGGQRGRGHPRPRCVYEGRCGQAGWLAARVLWGPPAFPRGREPACRARARKAGRRFLELEPSWLSPAQAKNFPSLLFAAGASSPPPPPPPPHPPPPPPPPLRSVASDVSARVANTRFVISDMLALSMLGCMQCRLPLARVGHCVFVLCMFSLVSLQARCITTQNSSAESSGLSEMRAV